jgi:hypothetical protein
LASGHIVFSVEWCHNSKAILKMTSFEDLLDIPEGFEDDYVQDDTRIDLQYEFFRVKEEALMRELHVYQKREALLQKHLDTATYWVREERRQKLIYKRKFIELLENCQPPRSKKVCKDYKYPNCEICGEKCDNLVTIKRESEPTGDWAVCPNCHAVCPDCKIDYLSYDAYLHCLCEKEQVDI